MRRVHVLPAIAFAVICGVILTLVVIIANTDDEHTTLPAPQPLAASNTADPAHPPAEVDAPLMPPARIAIRTVGPGFGIRRFAREVDPELAGVRIFTKGDCADHRNVTCVVVRSGHYGLETQHRLAEADCEWYGLTSYPAARRRVVHINLSLKPSLSFYAVMAHEFGHVLGLNHHAGHGVTGQYPDELHLSPVELRVLRRAYPR